MQVHQYALRIRATPSSNDFRGTVEVRLHHDGGPLVLHAKDLTLDGCRSEGSPLKFTPVPERQEVHLEGVPAGNVTVEVDYHGVVSERGLMGLYRTDYGKDPALVTQLEPCGARQVFPCVDHPAQKAEFHVTVDAPAGLQVLFNTPQTSEKKEGDRVLHTFAPTPRMSTYLLFLGIGNFEERSRRHGNVEIIVACPPGKGDQSTFALEHAAKVLDYFGGYFGIPYPLPKLHLVAVPNTAVGGMENWGAIAFRERALLLTPEASQSTRRTVLGVIAHEIAHQWFGDLVTMAWWNDLWLNESFATFMDFKATSHLYPDWQVWSDFSVSTSNAQLWDALPSSHPVSVKVDDPDQITGIFDEISYAKGASLLRMIEGYVGEEAFQRGVARYLAKFAYGNARGEDLWAALDQETKEPVAPVLQAWVNQPGYPALQASAPDGHLQLDQERFLLFHGEGKTSPSPPWPIPLLLTADGRDERRLMSGTHLELPLKDRDSVVVNHGRSGYLRVRYQGDLAKSIQGRFPRLQPRDRWGVLQDTYAFLLAGQAEPSAYVELVRSMGDERDYLVLNELRSQLGLLGSVLYDRPAFRALVVDLSRQQVERLGLASRPGEPSRDAIQRQGWASERVWFDPEFAAQLATGFPRIEQLDASIREPTAAAYARSGGDAVYEPLRERLLSAKNDDEKSRYARAMGAFRDPAALEKAVALPFSGEINPALGIELFASCVGNPEARTPMWGALQQTIPVLVQMFGGSGLLPLMLQWSVPFMGIDREPEVRKYFDGRDVADGASGLRKGFELLRVYSGVRRAFP